MKASKLADVYDCFDNNPIPIDDLDKYYVDADGGRGLTPLKQMERCSSGCDGYFKRTG
jgi:hypothetical protein